MDSIQRSKTTENSFLVIHNDLPANNLTSLFDILNQDSIYFGSSNDSSFYEQCLPSNFLTIDEELAAFKTQAQYDYAQFLEHRSCELIKGSALILPILAVDEEGKMPCGYACYYLCECVKLL
ncbi:unnamed protein product [Rotaria socialis]|nr:unnamed protein product [Rotaria socialis]CAF3476088.1 unnamed protein product [Rotaria socialis]CAF3521025.1 unnamed protein product [Rotaria socialis]CAF3633271.1 unnamed protein product [Rotaria socialis]CAF4505615.1 unnamed protein product [Rotaria socialis]